MKHNNDFKYDLVVGELKESELSDILSNSKIEIKYDLIAHKTGNVFVEYESRGKPSGISKTQSDFYCFAISRSFVLISLSDLKDRCRRYIGTNRDVRGGDSDTSKGILLPIKDLI
tara:strand:+ start:379 stop:723 length:345 start_codon:yes stop_codon:yes gene_type:complete